MGGKIFHNVRAIFIIQVVICVFMIPSVAFSDMKTGEENKELSGGSRGKIFFPHRMHQKNLGDCNICHSIFPKSPGSIEAMKARGEIRKKQIMKELCITCHKAEQKAGHKAGPTRCSKCHVR